MQDIKKTIAIQVTDQEFLDKYEQRMKETGMKVKDYLMSLITADIEGIKQTAETQPAQAADTSVLVIDDPALAELLRERLTETGLTLTEYLTGLVDADSAQSEQAPETSPSMPARDDDYTETIREHIENQISNGYVLETDKDVLTANLNALNTRMLEIASGYGDGMPLDEETDAIDRLIHDTLRQYANTQMEDTAPKQQTAAEPPAQTSGETTNLFVKITKEQREALNALKTETGETAGSVLNRVISGFLDSIRGGSVPEDFESTYQYYASQAKACDTTCSAVVPTQNVQELAAYLDSTGKNRNVLMSSLVHMEINGQSMEQNQGMSL